MNHISVQRSVGFPFPMNNFKLHARDGSFALTMLLHALFVGILLACLLAVQRGECGEDIGAKKKSFHFNNGDMASLEVGFVY
ncbi:hypothetical protein T4D_2089 [Trichinella pseudospiralis]|uniref:Uncharacterized protein n=1 Tax=Trichinella pseudospiralis TaxID=6337 RepID=A0A0V1FW77_TRIPS|nr:hypothetical protein T4D_2089 [Trichinella pseudospiralis]